jgi:hypothetical protein
MAMPRLQPVYRILLLPWLLNNTVNWRMQPIMPIFAAIVCALPTNAQTADTVTRTFIATEQTFLYHLGDRDIAIKRFDYGNNGNLVMINLHHNEATSVEAARKVLAEAGGVLLLIENDNERLISFDRKGKTYTFDPNRMFTRRGIKASIRRQSPQYSGAAMRAGKRFGKFVLKQIPGNPATLIALHNNDEGRLSILSYMKDGVYQKEAAEVHQNGEHDPDNFFLTTDPGLYGRLRDAGFNIVLQNNRRATDDGSLSIYYGRRRLNYINVEAEMGKIADQHIMLNALITLVR